MSLEDIIVGKKFDNRNKNFLIKRIDKTNMAWRGKKDVFQVLILDDEGKIKENIVKVRVPNVENPNIFLINGVKTKFESLNESQKKLIKFMGKTLPDYMSKEEEIKIKELEKEGEKFNKEDNKNFINMLKWVGIAIVIAIFLFVGMRLYFSFFG